MGALRKAGVWLGLVEDEDERHGGERFDEDFGEDEDFAPVPPRTPGRLAPTRAPRRDQRGGEPDLPAQREFRADRETGTRRDGRHEPERRPEGLARADRAGVRQLGRPNAAMSDSAGTPPVVGYATRDNLALAPQVQLRERAVVGDDQGRRYQITTLHPTSYSQARTIGEQFRDGVPVIMNLTDMAEADAKRLVDFAAGLAFGLRGTIERVTNRVFLLSPADIQVTAEDKARIAEGGFFDQNR